MAPIKRSCSPGAACNQELPIKKIKTEIKTEQSSDEAQEHDEHERQTSEPTEISPVKKIKSDHSDDEGSTHEDRERPGSERIQRSPIKKNESDNSDDEATTHENCHRQGSKCEQICPTKKVKSDHSDEKHSDHKHRAHRSPSRPHARVPNYTRIRVHRLRPHESSTDNKTKDESNERDKTSKPTTSSSSTNVSRRSSATELTVPSPSARSHGRDLCLHGAIIVHASEKVMEHFVPWEFYNITNATPGFERWTPARLQTLNKNRRTFWPKDRQEWANRAADHISRTYHAAHVIDIRRTLVALEDEEDPRAPSRPLRDPRHHHAAPTSTTLAGNRVHTVIWNCTARSRRYAHEARFRHLNRDFGDAVRQTGTRHPDGTYTPSPLELEYHIRYTSELAFHRLCHIWDRYRQMPDSEPPQAFWREFLRRRASNDNTRHPILELDVTPAEDLRAVLEASMALIADTEREIYQEKDLLSGEPACEVMSKRRFRAQKHAFERMLRVKALYEDDEEVRVGYEDEYDADVEEDDDDREDRNVPEGNDAYGVVCEDGTRIMKAD